MNILKFRCECEIDFLRLYELILGDCQKIVIERPSIYCPDVEVTLSTKLGIADLRFEMNRVPDSYVMIDTLAQLDEYTGERKYIF